MTDLKSDGDEPRRSCCWQSYSADVQGMRTGKPLFGVEEWHGNIQVCCWFDNGCHEHSAVLGRCYVSLPSVAISLRRLLLWVESESSSPWMSTSASGIACGGNNGKATRQCTVSLTCASLMPASLIPDLLTRLTTAWASLAVYTFALVLLRQFPVVQIPLNTS